MEHYGKRQVELALLIWHKEVLRKVLTYRRPEHFSMLGGAK